jgi:hypothetical protein
LTRAIPDQTAILDWVKRTNHLRGITRDYLGYGRMLRPWRISGVTERNFEWGKEPPVQSATWQAANGRIGIALANFGDLPESPRVELEDQGNRLMGTYLGEKRQEQEVELPPAVDIKMNLSSLCLMDLR